MADVLLPGSRRIYTAPTEKAGPRDVLSAVSQEAERLRFKAMLAELLRPDASEPTSPALAVLPPALTALHIDAGGSPARIANPLVSLETLGQLNAVFLFNVGHITGDTFLLKSAVAAMRKLPEDDTPHVQPVQDIDGDVSGKK